jgi:colicin import membrane protein
MAAVLPRESSWLPAAVLSTAVHLLLFLVLVFGVSWQSRQPETVSVELWDRPEPVVQAPRPEPKPEPKPLPKPEPPPPPRPAPKPEPVKKPDIALEKDRKAPPKKKEEPKKEEPLDLRVDLQEQINRELQKVQPKEKPAPPPPKPVAGPPAPVVDPTYANRISAKIKGNIILPANIIGNPEAVFDVVQLPTGEVLSARLRTSSGNKSYDEAVERAIFKSSPLPLPDRREQFQRSLELRFRPLDK